MRTQQTEGVNSPQVRLRVAEFRKYAKARGYHNALGRATLIGVHHTTIGRIEDPENDNRLSERFIAQVLVAFPELDFKDLFEIVAPVDQALRDAS